MYSNAMHTDPRTALEELIEAFRAHFELAQSDVDTDSDEFLDVEERLTNAFFTYDDALFTQLEVELPFELLDEEDFDEDEEYDDFDTVDFDDDSDDEDDDTEDEDDDFVDVDD